MILFFVRLKIFQHRMPKLRIFFLRSDKYCKFPSFRFSCCRALQIASSETQRPLVGRCDICILQEHQFGSARIPSHRLARKIFFWPISEEIQPGDSVALLYEVVFLIDRVGCLARKDSRKKRFSEAQEITSCNKRPIEGIS